MQHNWESQYLLKGIHNNVVARVLLVDDFVAFRYYVRQILMNHPIFEVVGEATDGLTAVRKAQELRPDIILLDIAMPLLNGFEAARQLTVASSTSKIIFLTEHEASAMVRHALSLGVNGYLLKSHAGTELLPALEAVTLGEVFISDRLRLEDLPEPDGH